MGNQEGTLEQGEKDMLRQVFEFTDLHAADIMQHRMQVKAISLDATYSSVLTAFTANGYSRLPVYDGEPSNYIGLLHYKDVLFYRNRQKTDCVKNCMRKLRFIPGTMSAVKILQVFKVERISFAAVVDEYGGNLGIVTMNDVLNVVLAFGTI
jgi:putative hemolysin